MTLLTIIVNLNRHAQDVITYYSATRPRERYLCAEHRSCNINKSFHHATRTTRTRCALSQVCPLQAAPPLVGCVTRRITRTSGTRSERTYQIHTQRVGSTGKRRKSRGISSSCSINFIDSDPERDKLLLRHRYLLRDADERDCSERGPGGCSSNS